MRDFFDRIQREVTCSLSVRSAIALSMFGVILLMSGCVVSSSMHHYTLLDGRALSPSPLSAQDSVGVASITLPRLLNRPQLVRRTANAELIFEEQYQWGGRLQEEIQQLLIDEWQAVEPNRLFYAYPNATQISTTEVRSVDIIQLDGQLGGVVQLQAICRARSASDRHLLWQKNIALLEQMTSAIIADYVAVLRVLVRRLARECETVK
jgi:uncharacterized lipoprotein YmbA